MSDQMSLLDQRTAALEEGRRRRDEGMARALANSAPTFREEGARIIRELAGAGRPFNADDLRQALEQRGHLVDNPNSVGPIFAAASRAKLIRRTGDYRATTSVSQHAHAHPLWIGCR